MEKYYTSKQDGPSKILGVMTKISFSVMQHAFFFCVSNSVKHFFENLNLTNLSKQEL